MPAAGLPGMGRQGSKLRVNQHDRRWMITIPQTGLPIKKTDVETLKVIFFFNKVYVS